MSTQPFDPQGYKDRQRQEWNAVAEGWRKWWPLIEQGAQQVSERLVDLAGVEPGHRMLDVATGVGEPAVTAARRVGPQGLVVATDQSPEMLAIARERGAALGLSNLEFHAVDAETLDFPEGSFDAALCRWGLMFLPDAVEGLQRIRRLLVPGGRFATSVWGPPQKTPLLSLAMGVLSSGSRCRCLQRVRRRCSPWPPRACWSRLLPRPVSRRCGARRIPWSSIQPRLKSTLSSYGMWPRRWWPWWPASQRSATPSYGTPWLRRPEPSSSPAAASLCRTRPSWW